MRRDRLEVLVKRLRKVPESKFDLNSWGIAGKVNGPAPNNNSGEKIAWCGTTGCAMGWAGTIKQFNKDGFYTVTDGRDNHLYPYFEGKYSFEAAAMFFEVDDQKVTDRLFDPCYYEFGTLKAVIERIEMLIASDEETFADMVNHNAV